MRTASELDHLREQAISLRRAGKSRREIKEILGPIGYRTLDIALAGEPAPEWTRRPNAKDDLRARARELRAQGLDYEEIVAALGVSKSSVSLWVRDMPRPEHLSPAAHRRRSAESTRLHWAAERPVRAARRAAAVETAAAEIGSLTDRELLIAGAISYWCEGAKARPGRHGDGRRVSFVNSDPSLVLLYLRFLAVAGVAREDLTFRLAIHETADVKAAEAFWLQVTGSQPEQFRRTTIKEHNPATNRKNVGDAYHGCLRIDVRRSSSLYMQIEGWASAVLSDGAAVATA
jgi:transcriptional regulator with XRE-family HTH domain